MSSKKLSTRSRHAVVSFDGDKAFIQKGTPEAKISLNGKIIENTDLHQLHHHDRLLFGTSNLYVFSYPKERDSLKAQGTKFKPPTYEEAQVDFLLLVTTCTL
jgi:hypothetical protein